MAALNCLCLTVILHSVLGTCGFYAFTVMANLEQFVRELTIQSLLGHYNHHLTTSQWQWAWSVINSSLHIGCLIGSLISSPIIKYFGGRDTVMLLKNIIFMVSGTLQFASVQLTCVELLVIGRLLWGIGHVLGMFTPVVVSECSPLAVRGQSSNAVHIGFRVWAVLGAVLTLPQLLGTQNYWYFCFLLPIIPSFLHLLSTYFIPESPKGLYANEHPKACERAVKYYHGKDCDLKQVLEQYASELSLAQQKMRISQILKQSHLRWPMFLCLLASASLPLSGLMVVYSYSTSLIASVGIKQENAALFSAFVIHGPCLLMSVISTLLVERCGRKLLLLAGLLMVLFGQLCVLVTPFVPFGGLCSAAGQLLVTSGASLVLMIVLNLCGELCPIAIRPVTFGCSSVISYGLSLITVFAFPPLDAWIGTYAMLPFFVATLFMFVTFWVFLPETKSKTVEQVLEKWMV